MNKIFFILLAMILITACGSMSKKSLKNEMSHPEEHFNYSDKSGKFLVKISSGFNKKDRAFFYKKSMEIPEKKENNILEQSITFSDVGTVRKKQTIVRPKLSQYTVWFEGKKYFSELKMNPAKEAIEVKMVSPEENLNGTKIIKLPSTKVQYCFFSQVMECARAMGFIGKANSKEGGQMNFYVVWEGYPYINEVYSGVPVELFSKAQLEYDGKTKDNEIRYNLKVAGQSIFFIVDDEFKMKKMFWVSQGISMVSNSYKKKNAAKTAKAKVEPEDDGEDFE
jgi:hypothetical protein